MSDPLPAPSPSPFVEHHSSEMVNWARVMPETISSLVRSAAQGEESARNEMARMYRGPILAWLIMNGCSPEQAEDVTQEFLAGLLHEKKGVLQQYDFERGKLRPFLRASARNFLNAQRRKHSARKRGGGVVHFSLEMLGKLELAGEEATAGAASLDAAWARSVYQLVLESLETKWCADPKREKIYRMLQPELLRGHPDYTQLEETLERSNELLRQDFSRLRQDFRTRWMAEVRRIVADPADVEPEARELMRLLLIHPPE